MNRNIAFFITANGKSTKTLHKSKKHFTTLVDNFRYHTEEIMTEFFSILIAFEQEITIEKDKEKISFPIGNLGDKDITSDRYLKITIAHQKIVIENDYAGTIPVYYSYRDYISLSNIEPCVVIDTKTNDDDLSYENIYGFMRYMHYIWDETAYKHIFTMLPDSLYTFDQKNLVVNNEYLATIKSCDINEKLTDYEISSQLNNLNDKLVYDSLNTFDQIILPLSSGYDSRMILASICKIDDLKEKLHCFTYGSEGSVEVEAARRLTNELNVKWDFIDLPLKFLTKKYLFDIHDVFGSSLHMHGMYQLEFFNEISKKIKIKNNSCLTSGFMTGVPAGQHNSLLSIKNNKNLSGKMNKFSQSCYWTDEELNEIDVFKNQNYIIKAENRFKKAFDRFDGKNYQKSVIFDLWTRQRNFIGYYPRTLEWKIPTVSPHMNIEYINFFMSISKKHLDDRLAVELMFSNHYPHLSKIVSNSNGLKSISNQFENTMFLISRVFRKFKLNLLLPKKYQNNSFEFSLPSVRHSKEDSFYPLLDNNKNVDFVMNNLIDKNKVKQLYVEACKGSVASYEKIVTLQSIALSVLKIENIK